MRDTRRELVNYMSRWAGDSRGCREGETRMPLRRTDGPLCEYACPRVKEREVEAAAGQESRYVGLNEPQKTAATSCYSVRDLVSTETVVRFIL